MNSNYLALVVVCALLAPLCGCNSSDVTKSMASNQSLESTETNFGKTSKPKQELDLESLIGLSKEELIEVIGAPDLADQQFPPKGCMQYSNFYEEDPRHLHFQLKQGKVVGVERKDFIYGPPPG